MNRFCSMFSQILQLFPRSEFELLVRETKAERHARGFGCWDQFVSMMFCQLRCVPGIGWPRRRTRMSRTSSKGSPK